MAVGLNRQTADQVPTAFFHGRGPVWEKGRAGRMDCLSLLRSVLMDRGYVIEWRELSDDVERLAQADPRHLHVVVDDMPVAGDNVLFCVPSYLNGFWYLDRVGTRNNSAMRTRLFRPQGMSRAYAREFAGKLRAKFIDDNRSKFDQELVDGFTPEPGAICIFPQRFKAPKYYRHYMSYPDLIDGVIANRGTRRIYIKPHPRQKTEELAVLMGYHDPGAGIEVTTHSIHGLLAQAGAAVSLSSAVLVEAQMHGVPGVVAGQVDFHHNMVVIREPDHIGAALEQAFIQRFEYEKFLVFFFAHGMVQPRLRRKALERMGAVLTEMGFGAHV
ncbi:hypothetical protein AADZ90_013535 [Aestuariibius sp. 2305UL40-4]|uniref:hypothetical protein n=1 Tax=Aestuariibius violaceus TaxID=3234132 RepID=UPI00345E544E